MKDKILLCVNIDHVATIRQARKGIEPSLVEAAQISEAAGADGITVHLREDRRHIQDFDLVDLKKVVKGRLTMEMATTEEMLQIAKNIKPDLLTLVPEKREELTTEGGLNVKAQKSHLKDFLQEVQKAGIEASIFIDPDLEMIETAHKVGAKRIELHTGAYANCQPKTEAFEVELEKLTEAAQFAHSLGFVVNAGHGLNKNNLGPILQIPHLRELHIGYSIVSRAILVGLSSAVKEIKDLI